MLNKTEYNGVMICVLPIGVEPESPMLSKKMSSRKRAPKRVARKTIEEEWQEMYEETFPKDVFVEETIQCSNGTITLKGSEYHINEVYTWLYEFGCHAENAVGIITIDNDMFHIFGDENDGNYRYFRGDFMHKEPYKCFGLVDVEPMEDGGQVWRDFSDFEVEATFKMYSDSECEEDKELLFF